MPNVISLEINMSPIVFLWQIHGIQKGHWCPVHLPAFIYEYSVKSALSEYFQVGTCKRPWICAIYTHQWKTNKRGLNHLNSSLPNWFEMGKKKEKNPMFFLDPLLTPSQRLFLKFYVKRALTDNFEGSLGLHKLLVWILDRYLTYSHLSKDLVKSKQILGGLFPKESLKHKGHIMNT